MVTGGEIRPSSEHAEPINAANNNEAVAPRSDVIELVQPETKLVEQPSTEAELPPQTANVEANTVIAPPAEATDNTAEIKPVETVTELKTPDIDVAKIPQTTEDIIDLQGKLEKMMAESEKEAA